MRTSALGYRLSRLLREESASELLRMGVARAMEWCRRLASTREWYIYRYEVPDVGNIIPTPRLDGVEIKFVECDADADRLVKEGYEDPRVVLRHADRRIRAGAVGCLAYVDKEFASAGWIGFSPDAKRTLDALPYSVDFGTGEACTGSSWTERRFRGRGLYAYVFGHELQYIREHGRTICRNSISVGNLASQLGQSRYGAQLCAVGRTTRVLWWRRWTERIAEGDCPSLSVCSRRA